MKSPYLKALQRSLVLALALGLSFAIYRIAYPNDFFLSYQPFKKNKDYYFKKSFSQLLVCSKKDLTPELQLLIQSPDVFLKNPKGWIKNNRKRTVSVIQLGNQSYFVKRYNYKNFFDYITKCPFRSSKAYRSFLYAHAFEEAGLSTPRPLAIFEKRWGFIWTSTYLIFDHEKGETLEDYLKNNKVSAHRKEEIIQQLSAQLEVLYQHQWVHRDLTLKNIFIHHNKLSLLDLDDIHSYAFKNSFFKRKFRKKHLNRLSDELSYPFELKEK